MKRKIGKNESNYSTLWAVFVTQILRIKLIFTDLSKVFWLCATIASNNAAHYKSIAITLKNPRFSPN
ncbi:MAG TPA: hypothetical protein DCM08_06155 [Microscillaceae bacterium]|nr:hypothetical protein [Microscillaceae bacterium]